MKKLSFIILGVLLIGLTISCTKEDQDGSGKIHVINELWVNYVISANGTELGIVPKEGEATWEVDPGYYSIKAETENLNFLLDDASTMQYIEAGQTFNWTLTE